jgi:hypothetical protein
MIHTLPSEVIEVIQKKCAITDRVRFNIALPKSAKFKLTDKDKKLMVLHEYMKRRPNKNHVTHSMINFMIANRDEETVKLAFKTYCKTNEHQEERVCEVDHKVNCLLSDIASGVQRNAEQYPTVDEIKRDHLRSFMNVLSTNSSIDRYIMLESNEKSRAILHHMIYHHFDTHLFQLVNNYKGDVVGYLIENEEKYQFDRRTCRRYVLAFSSSFASRKECRDILEKWFAPEREHYELMLDYAFDNMDVETFEAVVDIINKKYG